MNQVLEPIASHAILVLERPRSPSCTWPTRRGWPSVRFRFGAAGETIVEESESGQYDLLVLYAEDKVFGRPLFFGQGTATILDRAGCTTAVLISATSGDGLRSD